MKSITTSFDLKTLIYVRSLLSKTQVSSVKNICVQLHSVNLDNLLLLTEQNTRSKPCGVIDINASIVIHQKIALKLSLHSGSWILVKFISVDGCRRRTCLRWVHLFVSSRLNSASNQRCYIHQNLLHNLKKKLNSEAQISIELTNNIKISSLYLVTRIFAIWNSTADRTQLISKFQQSLSPPSASNIDVALVQSPDSILDLSLDELLREFFLTQKYVCTGDILTIPLPTMLDLYIDKYSGALPPKYAYFEVLDVSACLSKENELICGSNGCLVSQRTTNLYLKGSRESKVPYLYPSITSIYTDVPPLLENNFKKLNEVFLSVERIRNFNSDQTNSFERDPSFQSIPVLNQFIDENIQSSKPSSTDNSSDDKLFCITRNVNSALPLGHYLLIGTSGSGKSKLIHLLAKQHSFHIKWIDCHAVKGDTTASTEAKIKQIFSKTYRNTIIVLINIVCLSKDREGNPDPRVLSTLKDELRKMTVSKKSTFIIGTTHRQSDISDELWSMFMYQEVLINPIMEDRKLTLEWLFVSYFKLDVKFDVGRPLNIDLDLDVLSHRTAGFNLGDLEELVLRVHRSVILEMDKKKRRPDSNVDILISCIKENTTLMLDEMQSQKSEALGLPMIPKVNWNEIGGLEQAKMELINTIQLPIQHPHLISNCVRRSGILLYGPPGTGKTLLAKSVASECGLNFLSVKGPELLNMYIGQSEENVRQVFSNAKSASPCVVFFDELDSLAPNRGRSGDSGGVMDRIVSALLAELDGVSSLADVFVLAATNRPDLLDPALLRPGRFDKQIYLGVCQTNQQQLKILRAVTAKLPLDDPFSLHRIVDKLPFTLTGADFYALATDAFYASTRRTIRDIQEGLVDENEAKIIVTEDDFISVAEKLVPSVTQSELLKYEQMEQTRNR